MQNPNALTQSNSSSLTRREFLERSAVALFVGMVVHITGCGSDTASPTGPSAGDNVGSIAGNHGHSAFVTKVQLNAGNGVTLDIHGSATHTHNLILSASQVADIKANLTVTQETTTTNEHSHSITFN